MRNTLKSFEKIVKILLEEESTHPVSERVPSQEVYERLDLSLNDEGIADEKFEALLADLVLKTPRTATNAFFNQLFGGRNEKAVLGDLLAVMLNNSMYTYKAAGPQVGVEKVILREVCNLIGWGEDSDGTFAPGGSMSNFMSMLMARDAANAEVRYEGMQQKMIVYTSEDSHYSTPKNAAFSGIGRNNIRMVPTNEYGQMKIGDLQQMIEADVNNGFAPIMVNLTAGTTVMGAFDPIVEVHKLCDKHNMWLHVDGAYCGAVLFSNKYKHLTKGIELVDSFSFNAHKMLGTPLSSSIIVVRDKKHLYDSFSNDATYLYQTDHDDFNLGKTSLQCGRRNDALKIWSLWKSIGTNGLEKMVDHQFRLANVARDYVRNNPDYTLYSHDESISVCFNYKGISAQSICTALYEHSKLLVGFGTFNGITFIRLVTINAQNEEKDILNFFHILELFVQENAELFKNQLQLN